MNQADVERLARRVGDILGSAEAGTVVTVNPRGAVFTEPPGTERSAWERRKPAIAVFVATRLPPSQLKVRQRIQQGLRKLAR
jgi:hypothetical protein